MSHMPLEYNQTGFSWKSIRGIALMGVLIALSAVGAMIKIPSPVGTIGLDSFPGFFAALALGATGGMIVITLGHLLTAMVVGFPLTLPVHLFIAAQMALWAWVFRWTKERFGLTAAFIAGVFLNGVVSSLTMLLMGGWAAVVAVMPFLVVGSAVNVGLAAAAYRGVKGMRLM
ncbi:alpha-ribazole transporter [Heliobacterium gestii]|uniref:Alpha-ribazole transporter n=1 Tax=Heliomicrobium gestii TaxID=2699 RepID=A0A845LIN6_HELGE|nr:ECF transporter S component [Heliomicrobium gestii]MBM7865938.1 putative membrane protein [Heliomicrobium gestii]MZP42726.1 alpha-ribazole transporter [Heliomicrobium gestii]